MFLVCDSQNHVKVEIAQLATRQTPTRGFLLHQKVAEFFGRYGSRAVRIELFKDSLDVHRGKLGTGLPQQGIRFHGVSKLVQVQGVVAVQVQFLQQHLDNLAGIIRNGVLTKGRIPSRVLDPGGTPKRKRKEANRIRKRGKKATYYRTDTIPLLTRDTTLSIFNQPPIF